MPSRVIHGMLYRPRARTLDIVFRGDRGAYRYFDVPPDEWLAFKRAPSKGTYLNGPFKHRNHPYQRLEQLGVALQAAEAGEAKERFAPNDLPDANVWGFYENSL